MNDTLVRKKKLISFLTVLAIFSSSFDIFANVELLGLNFRFTQFISLPIIIICFLDVSCDGRMHFNKTSALLIIWLLLQAIFIINSFDIGNAIGYYLWLVFNAMIIYTTYSNVGKYYSYKWLIRVYVNSFVFNAILGLIQFILYPLGISFFVTQFWTDKLARINGFTFEPSFYATYMLMGFVLLAYLILKKDYEIFNKKKLWIKFIIVLLALVLSTSRMGWLMVMVFGAYVVFKKFALAIYEKRLVINKSRVLIILAFFLALMIGIFFLSKRIGLSIFLMGLGIDGGVSHSSTDRLRGLFDCLEVFKSNPLFGTSLGGVDPAIANYRGISYTNADNGMAMSIIGEMLVANGIVGLVPIAIYIINLVWARKNEKILIKALCLAGIFEIVILFFNQNILRPYVWWHMAMIVAMRKGQKVPQGLKWEK